MGLAWPCKRKEGKEREEKGMGMYGHLRESREQ